ncbi:hypothetical protein AND_010352 [Anopheles darlingi]|uniref:BCL-11A-like CCHC zinc finger domain-containing protein n=1 Tax=Anopheles darlingi TaxID=43151 RepID=W5J5C7_ANODA|nr:hypothetical protein AND_010352 [Anopheles darlingi]
MLIKTSAGQKQQQQQQTTKTETAGWNDLSVRGNQQQQQKDEVGYGYYYVRGQGMPSPVPVSAKRARTSSHVFQRVMRVLRGLRNIICIPALGARIDTNDPKIASCDRGGESEIDISKRPPLVGSFWFWHGGVSIRYATATPRPLGGWAMMMMSKGGGKSIEVAGGDRRIRFCVPIWCANPKPRTVAVIDVVIVVRGVASGRAKRGVGDFMTIQQEEGSSGGNYYSVITRRIHGYVVRPGDGNEDFSVAATAPPPPSSGVMSIALLHLHRGHVALSCRVGVSSGVNLGENQQQSVRGHRLKMKKNQRSREGESICVDNDLGPLEDRFRDGDDDDDDDNGDSLNLTCTRVRCASLGCVAQNVSVNMTNLIYCASLFLPPSLMALRKAGPEKGKPRTSHVFPGSLSKCHGDIATDEPGTISNRTLQQQQQQHTTGLYTWTREELKRVILSGSKPSGRPPDNSSIIISSISSSSMLSTSEDAGFYSHNRDPTAAPVVVRLWRRGMAWRMQPRVTTHATIGVGGIGLCVADPHALIRGARRHPLTRNTAMTATRRDRHHARVVRDFPPVRDSATEEPKVGHLIEEEMSPFGLLFRFASVVANGGTQPRKCKWNGMAATACIGHTPMASSTIRCHINYTSFDEPKPKSSRRVLSRREEIKSNGLREEPSVEERPPHRIKYRSEMHRQKHQQRRSYSISFSLRYSETGETTTEGGGVGGGSSGGGGGGGGGGAGIQDILTCGSCQRTFALSNIVRFIQHKVLQCNKDTYGQCYTQAIPGADRDSDDGRPLMLMNRSVVGMASVDRILTRRASMPNVSTTTSNSSYNFNNQQLHRQRHQQPVVSFVDSRVHTPPPTSPAELLRDGASSTPKQIGDEPENASTHCPSRGASPLGCSLDDEDQKPSVRAAIEIKQERMEIDPCGDEPQTNTASTTTTSIRQRNGEETTLRKCHTGTPATSNGAASPGHHHPATADSEPSGTNNHTNNNNHSVQRESPSQPLPICYRTWGTSSTEDDDDVMCHGQHRAPGKDTTTAATAATAADVCVRGIVPIRAWASNQPAGEKPPAFPLVVATITICC